MDSQLYPYREIINLLEKWEKEFEQEQSPEILALRQYDDITICEALSAIFMFAEADLRLTALDALPHIVPRERMTGLLIQCLGDPRSSVRWSACKLFQRYPDPQIIPVLIQLLEQDDNPTVRYMAADLLCEFGDEQALAALTQAAAADAGRDYEDRAVADAAREAIASIRERSRAARPKESP
jgi:HEAT repeat protein